MPIDPRLALMVQAPQLQLPSPVQQYLTLAQLRDVQTRGRLRDLQLADAEAERQELPAFQALMRSRLVPETAAPAMQPLRALVRPETAPPSPITREGITYEPLPTYPEVVPRGPETAAGGQGVPGPEGRRRLTWQEVFEVAPRTGWRRLKEMREAEAAEFAPRRLAAETQKLESDTQMRGVEVLDAYLGAVHDDASLQQVRRLLAPYPGLGEILPQTYDPTQIQGLRQRLSAVRRKVGLHPIYGVSPSGDPVVMQLTDTGQTVQAQLPPGVRVAPQPKFFDTGTSYLGYDLRTLQPLAPPSAGGGPPSPSTGGVLPPVQIPKEVRRQAHERRAGQEEGEYEGKRPQLARKAWSSLEGLKAKRAIVFEDIDKAISLATQGILTTGRFSGAAKALGLPKPIDLENLLTTISANMGFDELADIRASSPTGGALGPVSDFENRQLQSTLGSLRQEQSAKQLVANLQRLKTVLTQGQRRLTEAFQRDFGDLNLGPGTRSQQGTHVVTEADIVQTMAGSGRSREEVLAAFKTKGYTVQESP